MVAGLSPAIHYRILINMVKCQKVFSLLLVLCVAASTSLPYEITAYSSTYDYNYPTTTLLNVTDVYNQAYIIDLPFYIRFQGASHNHLKVSSRSYISFGDTDNQRWEVSANNIPSLLIDNNDNIAIELIVLSTSSNVTVHYRGRRAGIHQKGSSSGN